MSVESQLLALSPLDGRYAAKVDALRPIFSEYGLPKARVRVEVEWLLALAAEPGIGELAAFPEPEIARLRAQADGYSGAAGARVKENERQPNNTVKAAADLYKARDKQDTKASPGHGLERQ